MARSRFIKPQRDTLQISGGDWLLVRRRLNWGERQSAYGRMYNDTDTGLKVNTLETGRALITAYLLDWSLTDDDGNKVEIAGMEPEQLGQVLNNLDPEDFKEIKEAIEAHEARMDAAREKEKNVAAGENSEPAILPLPSDAAGALIGSGN